MKGHRGSLFTELWVLAAIAFLGSIFLLGCQLGSSKPSFPHPSDSEMKMVIPRRVTLVPGDVIEVKFFYTPELNENSTVRPDGRISLQLIGEVMAEGKTPIELRNELLELYKPHLKIPDIAVIVRSLQDRLVFVGGQVMTPGIVEMPGEMNVLEAVMAVGGFDLREAELKNVIVIRHVGGRRYGYSIDLKSALDGDETQPFYLEPKDIVYVPRTKIAKVDQWIDQHINKIIPDTGIFFLRTSGKTTIGVGSNY